MEVGYKFECLWDGNFSEGLLGCGFYVVITLFSYSKISVLSATMY